MNYELGMLKDEFFDLPHHRGRSSHDLIISKPDHPQPQCGQRLLPPFIFLIPRVIVPARKFVVDFISNAVMIAALADSFVFNTRIFEQPIHNIVD